MNIPARLILFIFFGGFLKLAVEVRYLHREFVHEQTVGWIPLVMPGQAALASIAAGLNPLMRKAAKAVFALGALAELVGVNYHIELGPDPFVRLITLQGTEKEREKSDG